MKYLIATSHEDEGDPETITGPMDYDEAAELFEQITGFEAPRKLQPDDEHTQGVTTLRLATIGELVTEEDSGAKNLDHVVDDFSEERYAKAEARAKRLAKDPWDEEEISDLFQRQLVLMALGDLLHFHEQEGNIRKRGVTSTGDIDYESLVPGMTVEDLL
jgi:hypothetical protein